MLVASTLKDAVNENNCHDTAQLLYFMDERISNVLNVEKDVSVQDKGSSLEFDDGLDGLYHQMGGVPMEPFGYDAVKQIILENHRKTLTEAVGEIWTAFENHRGDEPRRDDVELVLFKV